MTNQNNDQMKTQIIHPKWLLALCFGFVLWTGCRKDEDFLPVTDNKAPTDTQAPMQPKALCAPYANVSGMQQLVYMLNQLTACMIDACDGAQVTKSVFRLANPSGSVFVWVGPVPGFTPAMQQALLDAAYHWAWANRPPGYSIKRIRFTYTTDYDYPVQFKHYINLYVDYVLCEGQNCSPYQTLVGATPLVTELNRFMSGACIDVALACEGAHVTATLTAVLTNAGGTPYVFNNYRPANPTIQNEIMAAANSMANTIKPAGYAVSDIDFL